MAYVVAIANQKGGVAKTTTTVSLGGALVKMGRDVLCIDLDPQGDLTLALGVNPVHIRHSLLDPLLDSSPLTSVSIESSLPGLDLVPSNREMDLAEPALSLRPNYTRLLRQQVTTNGALPYDFILIDCPPSLGALTTNALAAANLLIIPTQAEYFSIYALRNVLNAVKRIKGRENPALSYRLLITMRDRRNRIHRQLGEQLQQNFQGRIFTTIIETDTRLRESAIAGLPISHYASLSRAALQYQSLAQELCEYVSQIAAQPA